MQLGSKSFSSCFHLSIGPFRMYVQTLDIWYYSISMNRKPQHEPTSGGEWYYCGHISFSLVAKGTLMMSHLLLSYKWAGHHTKYIEKRNIIWLADNCSKRVYFFSHRKGHAQFKQLLFANCSPKRLC